MERTKIGSNRGDRRLPEIKHMGFSSPDASFILRTKRLWPDMPDESIQRFIEKNRIHAEEKVIADYPNAALESAQYRALDYLYGKREGAIDEKEQTNPLVDILTVVSYSGSAHKHPSNFQLSAEGEPKPKPLIARVSKEQKREQYSYEERPWGRQEFRTISRIETELPTIVKGLYVINEAVKHHPLILPFTLQEYVEQGQNGERTVDGMAIGLLEILQNTGLLYDYRFAALKEQLRDIVYEELGDYKEIDNKYSYRIVKNRPFWYEGERRALERKKRLGYVKSGDDTEVETERYLRFNFPKIKDWSHKVRERAQIINRLRELTPFESLKQTAFNFTEEKAIEAIKAGKIEASELKEHKRLLEVKLEESLRNQWQRFIVWEVDEDPIIGQNESELISKATDIILEYFARDTKLSQKTRTNISRQNGRDSDNGYYNIDVEKLAESPLFRWILALRNPYIAKGFVRAVEETPESIESFYFLLKLMTYDVAKANLQKKEGDFLFDPRFKQNVDQESLTELLKKIRMLASHYVPDVRDIVRGTLVQGDQKIEDLLSEKYLDKTRARLEQLTYRTILRFFKWEKARKLTQEDKELARKVGKALIRIAGLALIGGISSYATDRAIKARNKHLEEVDVAIRDQLSLEEEEETAFRVRRELGLGRIAERIGLSEQARAMRKFGLETDENPWSLVLEELSQKLSPETAKKAVEALARNATFPADIGDRIPDAITREGEEGINAREALERIGIAVFGKILHLPERFSGYDGEAIAYFPWDISLQVQSVNNVDLWWWYSFSEKKSFENVELVDSIDNLSLDYEDEQLAYALNGLNPVMRPPTGWKFVKVYQEGGSHPDIGALGELYYDPDNLPFRVSFVLEPREMESLVPRVNMVTDTELEPYYPYLYVREARELNQTLSGDPFLQYLHNDFINEISKIDTTDQEAFSQAIIKYAEIYADYTNEYRYYALSFQVDKEKRDSNEPYLMLKELANRPDEGYFCSLASYAFRDFIASGGVAAGIQPGIALYNIEGYLVGSLAHQNNIILLPNGSLLEVDMTPYATEKTPQEDIEAFAGRTVSLEEVKKAIEELNSQQDVVVGDEQALVQIEDYSNEIERSARDESLLQADIQKRRAIEEILNQPQELLHKQLRESSVLLNEQPLPLGDNSRGQEILETLDAYKRITRNAEQLMKTLPRTQDILRRNVSAEEVENSISLLEQIGEDAKYLKDSVTENPEISRDTEENLEAINQIISDAEFVKESLLQEAKKLLEEAGQERKNTEKLEISLMQERTLARNTRTNGATENLERMRSRGANYNPKSAERIEPKPDIPGRDAESIEWLQERVRERRNNEEREVKAEEKNGERQNIQATLKSLAIKLGVGVVPLATAYFGLRYMHDKKKREEVLGRIERSLQKNGRLTGLEKDLVTAAVGNLSFMSYSETFPKKAATVLSLLRYYSDQEHEASIRWLSNEGTEVLLEKTPQKGFARLVDLAAEDYQGVTDEIQRNFPQAVKQALEKQIKALRNNGKNSEEIKDMPFDFMITYGLAKLIFNDSLVRLTKDVWKRIGASDLQTETSIKYKEVDILNLLHRIYSEDGTTERVKPLYNAIYYALSGKSSIRLP